MGVSVPFRGIGSENQKVNANGDKFNEEVSVPFRGIGSENRDQEVRASKVSEVSPCFSPLSGNRF